MLRLISFILLLTELLLAQGITVNRKHYFDNLEGGSPPTYEDTLFNTSGTSLSCCDNDIFVGTRIHCGNDITPASDYAVSRVSFYVGAVDGDISAVDFIIEIWTMTGDALTDSLASSGAITGLSVGWNIFTFSTPYLLGSGTKYGIMMARSDHGVDASNNPDFTYGSGDGSDWSTGEVARSYYWTLVGTYVWDYSGEWSIRLYGDALP